MNNQQIAKTITKRLAQQKRQQINKIVDNWKETKMIRYYEVNGKKSTECIKDLKRRQLAIQAVGHEGTPTIMVNDAVIDLARYRADIDFKCKLSNEC